MNTSPLKPSPRRPVALQVPFRYQREQCIPWAGDTMRPVEISVGCEICYDGIFATGGPSVLLTPHIEGEPTIELSFEPREARLLAHRLCEMADCCEGVK